MKFQKKLDKIPKKKNKKKLRNFHSSFIDIFRETLENFKAVQRKIRRKYGKSLRKF